MESSRVFPCCSTLLAGQRTTIADVALACAARAVLEGGGGSGAAAAGALGARDLAGIPHVLRWYRTVTHHPAFSAASAARASSSSRALPGAGKGQGKQKQKQKQQQKPAAAARAAAAGGTGAAAAASEEAAKSARALGGAATGEDPLPVLGDGDGDLTSSSSVVQGARRLELAPARFRRKRVRVRELLASGTALVGKRAVVKGWLRTARAASKGALLFLVVDDGSCSETVQASGCRHFFFFLSSSCFFLGF